MSTNKSSSTFEIFRALGESLEETWAAVHWEERAFSAIASSALERARPLPVSPASLIADLWSTVSVPTQLGSPDFGEPPIVVYRGEYFYIEVLFWMNGTTAIHEHGFTGAFQVLAGSSIHTRYSFAHRRRVNSRLELGDVRPVGSEHLSIGSVVPIEHGRSLIHALFHLEKPSATIVVRTYRDSESQPQMGFLPPFVAFANFELSQLGIRRRQAIGVLQQTDVPAYKELLRKLIVSADLESTFFLLMQCFDNKATRELAVELLKSSTARHGSDVALFLPCFEERARSRWIAQRRERVVSVEGRFLLALLLNVPNQADLLRIVAKSYPGDPKDVVVSWLESLCRSDEDSESLLDLELDESALSILRLMLDGAGPEQLVQRLKEDYDGVDDLVSEVGELCIALRTAPLLKNLFAASE